MTQLINFKNKAPETHIVVIKNIELKQFSHKYWEGVFEPQKIDFSIFKENETKFILRIYDSSFKDKALAKRGQYNCNSLESCVEFMKSFAGI